MKKLFALFAAIAVCATSCNLVEDIFDWSGDKEDKEFASDIWTSAQRNVVTVELSHRGIETVILPESGDVAILPDYGKGTASLLFKSFKIVDPEKEPDDWSFEKGITWIRKALYVYMCVNDVPFKVLDEGKIKFSKKTVKGSLTYGDLSADMINMSNKRENCKFSISGEMTQEGAIDSFRFGVPMTGNLNIKIITPDGEHLLIGYTKLDTSGTDEGFLNLFH
ncbi:MAG: hypothetical protein IJ840_04775 [Bacteroidales bacterium]|nr:hypothetical protein [Bacteroidales bacterium]